MYFHAQLQQHSIFLQLPVTFLSIEMSIYEFEVSLSNKLYTGLFYVILSVGVIFQDVVLPPE